MAKSHSTRKQKKPKFNKRMFVATAIVFVIFGILAIYFGVAWYQGYKFRQVEVKMNQLADAFVAELGEPADRTNNQSCGYASAPYGHGFLSCSTSTRLYYDVKDVAQARTYVNNLQNTAQKRTDIVGVTFTRPVPKDWSIGSAEFEVPSNTITANGSKDSCSVYYNLLVVKSLVMQVYLTCTTNPMRPFYPVSD